MYDNELRQMILKFKRSITLNHNIHKQKRRLTATAKLMQKTTTTTASRRKNIEKNEKKKSKNKNWFFEVVKILSITPDELIPLNYCKNFIYH